MGKSARTNKRISNPSFSSVRDHSLKHDHPYTPNDFRIVQRLNGDVNRKLLETIYIKHTNPSLNAQLDSNKLNVL